MVPVGSIKERVKQLIKKYGTNDPFEIAKAKGIEIRYAELGKILGFHIREFRTSVININQNTSKKQQLFIGAHELGHALMHPDINTPFLKSNTYFSTDRIEIEANTFAIELLFYDCSHQDVSMSEATDMYGIPEQLLITLRG